MKPGRNDPCPCGSGRKLKRCCGEAPTGTRAAGKLAAALRWVLRALAG